MSHELRTPLNGILGYAQILGRQEKLTPAQANAVSIIHSCGEHLLTLINDILDLSKIEARKMELQTADFHLLSFLEAVVAMFQIRAQQKKCIAFAYEQMTPLPPVIHADEKRLRQILINLIGNAIKFTDEGQITFRVFEKKKPGLENRESSPTSPYSRLSILCFEVEDTGIGIPPDKLEQIFLPFEQVSDARHRSEGTGLGLTITKNLVEAMNGRLVVESELGRGSTFRLELEFPALWIDVPEQPLKFNRRIIGYTGLRRRLLVVDDESHNRSMLVNLLEPLGFEMFEAEDGQQAVEQARIIQPDAIFIDLFMDVMDGLEATRQIRQITRPNTARRVVIIATSAHAFEDSIAQSLSTGCDAFLTKPIDVNELFALLSSHLQLDWLYQQPPAQASLDLEELPGDLVLPPPEEMAVLYDLAMKGELPRLRQQALRIEQMGEQYRAFTTRLCQLVEDFDEDQILALIERNLPQAPGRD
jgi:CheY-like chemotaxis protein